MKTFLLATTLFAGFAGLAQAAQPTLTGSINGSLNAGSESGQNLTLHGQTSPNGTYSNNPANGSVTSSGAAFSASVLNPLTGTAASFSTSHGTISGQNTGAGSFSGDRFDQATTGATLNANVNGSFGGISGQLGGTLATTGTSGAALHLDSAGAGNGGVVNSNGTALSVSTLNPLAGKATSFSTSNGHIDGYAVNGTYSGQRLDDATSQAKLNLHVTAPQGGITYNLNTTGESGQSMSLGTHYTGPQGYSAGVLDTSGKSWSDAQIGLTSTAKANTTGTINTDRLQTSSFDAERVDSTGASATLNANGVDGTSLNLGASAIAGHDLKLNGSADYFSYADGNLATINDTGSAFSQSTINPMTGTAVSFSTSKDTLSGKIDTQPQLRNSNMSGSLDGNSVVDANTDNSLSGKITLGGNIPQ